MVSKIFFFVFHVPAKIFFFSLRSILLLFMATHWKQRRLLCTTSGTCEVFSAIVETISLLSSYPHSYTMSHQALLEISITFSSICNPFPSCTNFFTFSTTIFMFSVQSSLDTSSHYFEGSKKLCFHMGDLKTSATFSNNSTR